jgi:hypothetical protein
LVDLAAKRANDLIGWEIDAARRHWLELHCANGASSLLPRYRAYQSVFEKTEARLLIKEEACYGGADNATAILAARKLGMVTAEYQHGAVSSGHDAYNFAPAVSNSHGYRQTLPDYFLSYGSWWGDQINAPIKRIAIGNPHRNETIKTFSAANADIRTILILGDGIETAIYLDLCERLKVALGGIVEVIFRPHPLERSSVLLRHPDGFAGNVRIDSNHNIYSSFREVGVVVSEISTGLFEAIGLVPKVFIWNTPKARFSFPSHPFQSFFDANELARLLRDDSAGRVSTQQIDSIWAPDWQRNYRDFSEGVMQE